MLPLELRSQERISFVNMQTWCLRLFHPLSCALPSFPMLQTLVAKDASSGIESLLTGLLELDPQERMTAEEGAQARLCRKHT